MTLQEQLTAYIPYNEQEAADRTMMLHLLQTEPDVFDRTNTRHHFTASAWLVNKAHDRVMMIYHNIYNSWAWTGGHADGETDLLSVALREAREETGLADVQPAADGIYSLEVLTVDGHIKRGQYVSSHLHLNVTYLLEADDAQPLRIKPDENSGVRWLTLSEAVTLPTEPWMVDRIYRKLNNKLQVL